jgi:lipoprotein-anchoring transpeptidase ErfK/SrfK
LRTPGPVPAPVRRLLGLLFAPAALIALLPAGGAQAAPSLQAGAQGTYAFGRDQAALTGRAWRVAGASAAGGTVVVRVYRGKKLGLTRQVAVAADGSFGVNLKFKRAGRLTVEAVAPGTGARVRFAVWELDPRARSGASMRFLQQRLNQMGYWPSRSGGYDLRTRWAVMAYRKVNRMARNFSVTPAIFERAARGAGRFVPRYGATGRDRVEAQISRQVYALIDAKGRVFRTLPMSSGKPGFRSDIGRFRFYRKTPGVNSLGMVNSTYYNGGEAIHGYPEVPTFPASHGCLRTPTTYSLQIMRWIRLGDRIDVYR